MDLISKFEVKYGDLLRWVGTLGFAQGAIIQYFTSIGLPTRIISGALGGISLITMIAGKHIDSKSYTVLQAAELMAPSENVAALIPQTPMGTPPA